MKPEVKERLIVGLIQYLNARASGSTRFAIADGYLAIDNYFSATLLDSGIDPPKNHKHKLKLMFKDHIALLQRAEVSQEDLEEFYNNWQRVRYSNFIPSPKEALNFLRLSYRIIHTIIEEFAHKDGKSYEELEEELYMEIMGSKSPKVREIGAIREEWQLRYESLAEMGIGSKLGNKMINPANFCDIFVLTEDPITKEIINSNVKIISVISEFYDKFLRLIEDIQDLRLETRCTPNEFANFMLSLRLSYHGATMEEIIKEWAEGIKSVLKKL